MTTYALRLTISYAFDRPSGAGRQLFRVIPAHVPGVQHLRRALVTLNPAPTEQGAFNDFFGTAVTEAAMPGGLTALELVLTAEVDRLAAPGPDLSIPLAGLAAGVAAHHGIGAGSPHHFLRPTPSLPYDPQIAAFAATAVQGCHSCRDTVEALGRALHCAMAFDATATSVDTPPGQAFDQRRGVCQDFAQIMIGGLRSLGIPAAYVGGYLRTLPPEGQPRLVGADAMHAWVRAWGGASAGWIDYDPTNACFALSDHVDIGFGPDYAAVAPVTGMLRLDGSQTGTHAVDIVEV